jgi:hypothetical protein
MGVAFLFAKINFNACSLEAQPKKKNKGIINFLSLWLDFLLIESFY